MIPRRVSVAIRFEMAARRLGRHKAGAMSVDVWSDYGNRWTVSMQWGRGTAAVRRGFGFAPYRKRRRGGKLSPERVAALLVRKVAIRKRGWPVLRKRWMVRGWSDGDFWGAT